MMDALFCFNTIKVGWSHVYNKGLQINFFFQVVFLSLWMVFVLVNRVNPDEMPHDAAFNLGLHCMPKCTAHVRVTSIQNVIKEQHGKLV